MFAIPNVTPNPAANPHHAVGGNAAAGNGFQTAMTLPPLSTPPQGVSAGMSSGLGSQTVSTLLQTQDLTQAHGGGGGGHHHGGIKMTQQLETEQAEEAEENGAAASLRRKNLLKNAAIKDVNKAEDAENDADTPEKENGAEEEKSA